MNKQIFMNAIKEIVKEELGKLTNFSSDYTEVTKLKDHKIKINSEEYGGPYPEMEEVFNKASKFLGENIRIYGPDFFRSKYDINVITTMKKIYNLSKGKEIKLGSTTDWYYAGQVEGINFIFINYGEEEVWVSSKDRIKGLEEKSNNFSGYGYTGSISLDDLDNYWGNTKDNEYEAFELLKNHDEIEADYSSDSLLVIDAGVGLRKYFQSVKSKIKFIEVAIVKESVILSKKV